MSWYKTGTVAINNASTTVTGSGTAWVDNVDVGEGILLPDGRTYEITGVVSNTSLTIGRAYLGSNTSGQPYEIQPFRGRIAGLTARASELLDSFQTVRDGIGAGNFPDGSAAAPASRFANDQDTGFYRAGTNILGFATGGVGRGVFDANGNFGIGTLTPTCRLNVSYTATDPSLSSSSGAGLSLLASTSLRMDMGALTGAPFSGYLQSHNGAGAAFPVAINPLGGNVGIGTTSPTILLQIGQRGGFGSDGTFSWGQAITGNNRGFLSWNTDIASVNAVQTLVLGSNSGAWNVRLDASGLFCAGTDNAQNLGSGSVRWATIYAGTGTINTSDEREKHWRGELTAAELRAAKRIIGELGIYQWNDAVAEKGEDGARLHFGVRAQRAFAIMEDEGLEWGRYAWACYDQWEEQAEPVMAEVTVTKTRKVQRPSMLIDPATGQPAMVEADEAYEETEMQPTGETRVTLEAGDRYGVRPDQLAFWLIAAQAAMQADLEARIAALEAA